MADGYPYSYFKCAPHGFDATVYDTDNLSITRGASLTLLAAPALLRAHLEARFADVAFEWLQASASELFWRASYAAQGLTLTPDPGYGAGQREGLQRLADSLPDPLTDDALRATARAYWAAAGLSATAEMVDQVGGHILSLVDPARVPAGAEALEPERCEAICEAAREFLAQAQDGHPFDLMLFNVAFVQPHGAGFTPAQALAALDTRLGVARLQGMNVVVPARVPMSYVRADDAVCTFTGVLAADSEHRAKSPGHPTSTNAYRRWAFGRDNKAKFYDKVLAEALESASMPEVAQNRLVIDAVTAIDAVRGKVTDFVGDFENLVAEPPQDVPLSVQTGICVLYMDGNSFGAKRTAPTDMDGFTQLSRYLDILKAGMLARILSWIEGDPEMWLGGKARFETLLWGGDEFIFVLPAWKGWELAEKIHVATKGWQTLAGEPLRFATGLVFGPHNAPIRDLKNAAIDLAELAKADRSRAMWQALAFESIDRVHFSPERFRQNWLGAATPLPGEAFSIPAEEAIKLPQEVSDLLAGASRSFLHKIYLRHQADLGKEKVNLVPLRADLERVAGALKKDDFYTISEQLFPSDGRAYPLLPFAQINLLLDYIQPKAGRE